MNSDTTPSETQGAIVINLKNLKIISHQIQHDASRHFQSASKHFTKYNILKYISLRTTYFERTNASCQIRRNTTLDSSSLTIDHRSDVMEFFFCPFHVFFSNIVTFNSFLQVLLPLRWRMIVFLKMFIQFNVSAKFSNCLTVGNSELVADTCILYT